MADTDTNTNAVTKARKPRTTTKAPGMGQNRATKFIPYTTGQGDKEMLDAESQRVWMDFWGTLTEKEKAIVGRALNVIITPPLFNQGYRKFFRFWRAAVRDLTSNLKF